MFTKIYIYTLTGNPSSNQFNPVSKAKQIRCSKNKKGGISRDRILTKARNDSQKKVKTKKEFRKKKHENSAKTSSSSNLMRRELFLSTSTDPENTTAGGQKSHRYSK